MRRVCWFGQQTLSPGPQARREPKGELHTFGGGKQHVPELQERAALGLPYVSRKSDHGGLVSRPLCSKGRQQLHTQSRAISDSASQLAFADSPSVPSSTNNVIAALRSRGLIDAITSEALQEAAEKPLKVYCGFDPTAESLHLGNLLGIIVLSWFQRYGHTPVALMGGATARVGDPSGKSIERPVMSETIIERNLQGIRNNLTAILKVASTSDAAAGGPGPAAPMQDAVFVNNYDWWKGISLLEFLRDVGKYARVGAMMAKESVKKRLTSEEGMSFTEFTYQLLQGYDFVHLNRELGVTVQLGGSDQWGNITAGTDLVRRLREQQVVYGLTWPLLLKSDGSKFGKSEGGAIWLSADMLSPYKFYQYLFATPDADVTKFMRMLTFMDLEEIAAIEAAMQSSGYEPNAAQRRLAEEVTRFVHGEEKLQEAISATKALAPGAATKLDSGALAAIADDIPSKLLDLSSVLNCSVVDLAVSAGLFPSKGAARRLMKQGGLYMNNEKVVDELQTVQDVDLLGGQMLLLAAGKKNKLVVRVS